MKKVFVYSRLITHNPGQQEQYSSHNFNEKFSSMTPGS